MLSVVSRMCLNNYVREGKIKKYRRYRRRVSESIIYPVSRYPVDLPKLEVLTVSLDDSGLLSKT